MPELISMRYPLFTLLTLLLLSTDCFAQADNNPEKLLPARPPKMVAGIVEGRDTLLLVRLEPVYVFPKLSFKNKREERYYWRLVRNVKICLPLARIVSGTLIETAEYLETLPNSKDREKHLKQMQRDLIRDYEPVLRKMSYSQGKILLNTNATEKIIAQLSRVGVST